MGDGPIPEHVERLFADARPAPDFMGITIDRARAKATAKGITTLRVVDIDPDGSSGVALTMDLRTDRLNVLVARGVVVRAGYF